MPLDVAMYAPNLSARAQSPMSPLRQTFMGQPSLPTPSPLPAVTAQPVRSLGLQLPPLSGQAGRGPGPAAAAPAPAPPPPPPPVQTGGGMGTKAPPPPPPPPPGGLGQFTGPPPRAPAPPSRGPLQSSTALQVCCFLSRPSCNGSTELTAFHTSSIATCRLSCICNCQYQCHEMPPGVVLGVLCCPSSP